MLHAPDGLFVVVAATDRALWSDGAGGGAGARFEVETDNSILLYSDPDSSRDLYSQPGDRLFGVNLGNPFDPLTEAGTVRRCKFATSNGQESFATEDVVARTDRSLPSSRHRESAGRRRSTAP